MLILLVGDPHAKKDNLESTRSLISWVKGVALEHDATVLFEGDQYNDFGVARVEVMAFWNWAYSQIHGSISLVGNHDINPDGSATAMVSHAHQTRLIWTEPEIIDAKNGVYGLGFIRDFEQFKAKVMQSYSRGARVIVCHAEFNGAQYENGFYSPHGFDVDAFPDDLLFISGHIHNKQALFSKKSGRPRVIYNGTPRMLTRSDIGAVKTVTLLDTEKMAFKDIEVPESVCPRFVNMVITPENVSQVGSIPDSPLVYVDLRGPKDFVQKTAKKMPNSVKLRCLPDPEERKTSSVKESDGVQAAFARYMGQYVAKNALSPEESKALVEMVYGKVPGLRI
jgi:hypothetical protein